MVLFSNSFIILKYETINVFILVSDFGFSPFEFPTGFT